MDLKSEIKSLATEISSIVDRYIDAYLHEQSQISKRLEFLTRVTKPITASGKRLRGILVVKFYEMFSNDSHLSREEILKLAVAVEIMHASMLVFDDVMDQSTTRRGVPTIHNAVADFIPENGHYDPKVVREALASCVGIAFESLPYSIIYDTAFMPEVKLAVVRQLSKAIVNTTYGQELDLLSEVFDDVSAEDVVAVHKYKTGFYTVCNPAQTGAIAAGVSAGILDVIQELALPTGIAYQIQDDILGMFGNEDELGKSIKSDVQEGKKTLQIIYTLQHANSSDKAFIKTMLGKRNLTDAEFEKVKEIVIKCGGLDYATGLRDFYRKDAEEKLELLRPFVKNLEAFEFIQALLTYLVQRGK